MSRTEHPMQRLVAAALTVKSSGPGSVELPIAAA